MPSPRSLADIGAVHRRTLDNGLRVLIKRDASAPVVAVVTWVSAGYFDETDDVVGIAHVLEHMYFKGTPSRGVGEIAKQTKAAGGYLNAATIYDYTMYYAVLPSSGFAQGLEVQADAYANSLIDADELSRELEVIIQEAKRKADNPAAVASETLYELLHDTHRIRRWRIGREPGLRALTRESLLRFYRNFYHPGNTVLSIVGDVDVEQAMALVEKHYGHLRAGAPERTPGPVEVAGSGFRYRELSGDIGQTQVAFGWRTPGTMDDDSPALELFGLVLGSGRGSRLYRAVRERKLASAVSAYHYTPTALGVFVMSAECAPETAADAARAMWEQMRVTREGPIAPGELERAKRLYEARWIRRLEDMEGQAVHLASWEALGGWEQGDRFLSRVLEAGVDDLRRVADRWLDPDAAGLLIYRPSSTPTIAADATSARRLLEASRPAPLAPAESITAAPAIKTSSLSVEREAGGARVYRSRRGVPILVRDKPGSPLVSIGTFMLGGASADEPELAGTASLMARTSVKGTERRSASRIAQESELLGGSVAHSVGSDSLGWAITVPGPGALGAIDLLADVVQHPAFDDAALETERSIAMSDIVALRDDMYRYPVRLALLAAFAGHPYGSPALGSEESLARITAEHVGRRHASVLRGSKCAIGVVCDSGVGKELAESIAAAFDALELGDELALPSPAWPSSVVTSVEPRDRAQTALAMLFPGPSRGDDDRFAAALIATIASGLGGRFHDELREKQSLSYTVHAFSSERRVAGAFGAYIATSPEKEDAAREGLLLEFAKLREAPVTADELERAKTYAVGVHQIHQQSGGSILGDVMDAWLFGSLEELVEYDARVQAVTAQRMLDVARKYFDPARRVEGIVRGSGRAV